MSNGATDDVAAEQEVPLPSGTMTTGVVRVGDTVRRPVGRWTPAVHSVLRHLERVGFEGAPRVLGIDDKGREMLTYLPSDPAPNWSDEALVAAGRLVRTLHEALADYVPAPDAVWRCPPLGRRQPGGSVGHNDLCTENTAFVDGVPYGFFDWDMAGPFRPQYDLALAAIAFAPLRPDRYWPRPHFPEPPDRMERLRLFLDAYGVEDRLAMLDVIETFQFESLHETLHFGARQISPYRHFLARGEYRFRLVELEWMALNREALLDALR